MYFKYKRNISYILIVSRFFRKFNSSRLVSGNQPAMISDNGSSSGLMRWSMFMYRRVPHWLTITWRNLAHTSIRTLCPSGKAPIAFVRRLISRLSRSSVPFLRASASFSTALSQYKTLSDNQDYRLLYQPQPTWGSSQCLPCQPVKHQIFPPWHKAHVR